jgi:hypothetical protein
MDEYALGSPVMVFFLLEYIKGLCITIIKVEECKNTNDVLQTP